MIFKNYEYEILKKKKQNKNKHKTNSPNLSKVKINEIKFLFFKPLPPTHNLNL